MPPLLSVCRNGLVCAAVAVALALFPLTSDTYLGLFYPESETLIQQPPPAGVPIPSSLAWPPRLYDLIERFAQLPLAAVLGLEIALYCILIYTLLRILNPTFRLTTGVDWDQTLLTRTYMHTAPLIKAFLIAVTAFIPVFLLQWILARFAFGGGIRFGLVGAVIWLLFSRNGVAGDYESGNYEFPRRRSELLSLLGRGALAGIGVMFIVYVSSLLSLDRLFQYERALGNVGPESWRIIAVNFLGISALLGLVGAGFAVGLGVPSYNLKMRWIAVAPSIILLAGVWYYSGRWYPQRMRVRYDYLPQSRQTDAQRLASLTGVTMSPSDRQAVLIISPQGAMALNVELLSVGGLDAGKDAFDRIEAFLKRRNYRTALANVSFETLYDSAALRWDIPERLRVIATRLENRPEWVYQRLFLDELFSISNIPEAQPYISLLESEKRFVCPDREAMALVGDLYARFGNRDRAQEWYRRAQIPVTRIGEVLSQKTRFVEGEVTGRLLLGDRPVAQARVGLIDPISLRNRAQMFRDRFTLRVFWLRHIAAVSKTDRDGRFAFKNLISGRYLLVVQIPDAKDRSFFKGLAVENAPAEPIVIDFDTPRSQLGDIRIVRSGSQNRAMTEPEPP
jgi:hypothetical protein